jgi:hypothetical protein
MSLINAKQFVCAKDNFTTTKRFSKLVPNNGCLGVPRFNSLNVISIK